MLRNRLYYVFLSLLLTGSTLLGAERVLVLKIGPSWPLALRETEKPAAGDASIHAGLVVDGKIAFGGGIDFLWNTNDEAEPIGDDRYHLISTEKTFMFPVSVYLAITPIPDFKFQPCISGQIGLNTMYFSHEEDSIEPKNGLYMGIYWKIAADAIYNLGENSGLFAGIDFQWSMPKKVRDEEEDYFYIRDMRGVGIRMGIRVIF